MLIDIHARQAEPFNLAPDPADFLGEQDRAPEHGIPAGPPVPDYLLLGGPFGDRFKEEGNNLAICAIEPPLQ